MDTQAALSGWGPPVHTRHGLDPLREEPRLRAVEQAVEWDLSFDRMAYPTSAKRNLE